MDENSRPRKQARLNTFLIPRRDEKATFSGICIQIKLIKKNSYEIAEFRIQELFEPLFKEK
jgi:hypothetical protein